MKLSGPNELPASERPPGDDGEDRWDDSLEDWETIMDPSDDDDQAGDAWQEGEFEEDLEADACPPSCQATTEPVDIKCWFPPSPDASHIALQTLAHNPEHREKILTELLKQFGGHRETLLAEIREVGWQLAIAGLVILSDALERIAGHLGQAQQDDDETDAMSAEHEQRVNEAIDQIGTGPKSWAPADWRDVTVEQLGLPPGLCEALRDAEADTLGKLDSRPLTQIPRIGPAKAGKIEAAIEDWFTKHPDYAEAADRAAAEDD